MNPYHNYYTDSYGHEDFSLESLLNLEIPTFPFDEMSEQDNFPDLSSFFPQEPIKVESTLTSRHISQNERETYHTELPFSPQSYLPNIQNQEHSSIQNQQVSPAPPPSLPHSLSRKRKQTSYQTDQSKRIALQNYEKDKEISTIPKQLDSKNKDTQNSKKRQFEQLNAQQQDFIKIGQNVESIINNNRSILSTQLPALHLDSNLSSDQQVEIYKTRIPQIVERLVLETICIKDATQIKQAQLEERIKKLEDENLLLKRAFAKLYLTHNKKM